MNNKFNKKKFEQNELSRLQNIHKTPRHYIPIIKPIIKPETHLLNQSNIDIPTIYKFKNHASTNFNLDLSRENHYDKVPKISFKEVPIPYYSETDKFDLNTINSNISTEIHMDIFASDIINDADVNELKKKGIHKIIHVYQEKYKSNTYATGLGDFIRSCFYIMEFCSKYNFQYHIIINHPISKFFKNFPLYGSSYGSSYNNNIEMFTESNFNKCVYDEENYIKKFTLIKQTFGSFLKYLCSLPVINNSVFSYNILFPYDNITIEQSNKLRFLFEPSNEINDKVNEILNNLSIIKKDYFILHIRSGDGYLIDKKNKFDTLYFQSVKDEITKFITKNKNVNILLISDNNIIKLLLSEIFPNIKFLVHDITHIGEGVKLQENKIKNTMIDFFLMANSSFIFSLTSYAHGTGFSYWCSRIYNIPYQCKFINVS